MELRILGGADELIVFLRGIEGLGDIDGRLGEIENTLGALTGAVVHIINQEEQQMANIDLLRGLSGDTLNAVTALGDEFAVATENIASETAQVSAQLDALVAAEGNQVGDADVQSARDHLARIESAVAAARAVGDAIKTISPDAVVEPPPVEPPVEEPPVEEPPVEPPVEEPPVEPPVEPPLEEPPVEPPVEEEPEG